MALDIIFNVKDNATKPIKDLNNNLNKLKPNINNVEKSFLGLNSNILKTVGSLYALNKGFDLTISNGLRYNKAIEQQTASIKTLLAATSANVDSLGNVLTIQDKYNLAQKESISIMKELEIINANTPQTLEQTAMIYKAMLPSMRQLGASQSDMISLTEKLAIASGSAGIEFNSLLAGVDGLATGTVLANSDLGRFLNSIGLGNETLKSSSDVVGLLTDKLKGFEALDTYGVAVSNLEVKWNSLTGAMTTDIFEAQKQAIKELTKLLNQLSDEDIKNIKQGLNESAKAIASFISVSLRFVNATRILFKEIDTGIDNNINRVKIMLDGMVLLFKETTRDIREEIVSAIGIDKAKAIGIDTNFSQQTKEIELLKANILSLKNEITKNNKEFDDFKLGALKINDVILGTEQKFKDILDVTKDIKKVTEDISNASGNLTVDPEAVKEISKEIEQFKEFEIQIRYDGLDQMNQALLTTADIFKDLAKESKLYNKAIIAAGKDQKQIAEVNQQHTSNQIGAYANLAGAMSGAFEEGSKGAKAFAIVSNTLAIAQGINAILNQGMGDPYTAFARMAAMAASVAALGVNVKGFNSGGGNGDYSSTVTNPNTTTVLGGGDKVSKSISESLELIADYSKPDNYLLVQMKDYLESINKSLGGVSKDILRTGEYALGVGAIEFSTTAQSFFDKGGVDQFLSDNLGDIYKYGNILSGTLLNSLGDELSSALGLGGGGYNWQKLAGSGIQFGDVNAVSGATYSGGARYYGDITTMRSSSAQTLEQAIADFAGMLFQNTARETMSKNFWGSASYSYYSYTTYQDLQDELKNALELTLTNIRDTITFTSAILGEDVYNALNDMSVNISNIDLKGLTGEQVEDKLNEAFSTLSDNFVKELYENTKTLYDKFKEYGYTVTSEMSINSFLNGGELVKYFDEQGNQISQSIVDAVIADFSDDATLSDFQQIGEGLYETLVRVSSGIAEAQFYTQRLGAELTNYNEIVDTHGLVAFESLSQSIIEMDEAIYGLDNGVVQIIETMNTSAEDLYDTYVALEDVRDFIALTGQNVANLSSEMFFGAGGIDNFNKSLEDFFDNFLTNEEQLAELQREVTSDIERLGLVAPTTAQGFKDLVASIDTSSAYGADLYGRLILLSDGFAEAYGGIEDFSGSLLSMSDSLQKTIDSIKGVTYSSNEFTKDQLIRLNKYNSLYQNAIRYGDTSKAEEYLGYVTSLSTSLSGSFLGSSTDLNQNLIASLEANQAILGLKDEILNVNIVSSEITDTTSTVPSVYVANQTTSSTEIIEALLTTIAKRQSDIYDLLLEKNV